MSVERIRVGESDGPVQLNVDVAPTSSLFALSQNVAAYDRFERSGYASFPHIALTDHDRPVSCDEVEEMAVGGSRRSYVLDFPVVQPRLIAWAVRNIVCVNDEFTHGVVGQARDDEQGVRRNHVFHKAAQQRGELYVVLGWLLCSTAGAVGASLSICAVRVRVGADTPTGGGIVVWAVNETNDRGSTVRIADYSAFHMGWFTLTGFPTGLVTVVYMERSPVHTGCVLYLPGKYELAAGPAFGIFTLTDQVRAQSDGQGDPLLKADDFSGVRTDSRIHSILPFNRFQGALKGGSITGGALGGKRSLDPSGGHRWHCAHHKPSDITTNKVGNHG